MPTPTTAPTATAFKEDAISASDAALAGATEFDQLEAPCFINDDSQNFDPPEHILVKTTRELFGTREDEPLEDALARLNASKQ
jgi:hypothetical protein